MRDGEEQSAAMLFKRFGQRGHPREGEQHRSSGGRIDIEPGGWGLTEGLSLVLLYTLAWMHSYLGLG